MALIGLSREAFRWYASVFHARRGLQDVKQVEADRLLDFDGAAPDPVFPDITEADIAPVPEILHVLLLGGEQRLESLLHHAIHRPLRTAADLCGGSRVRCVIDHVFGEVDRTSGLGIDREGNLAEVLGVYRLGGVWACGLKRMVRGAGEDHLALVGRMA